MKRRAVFILITALFGLLSGCGPAIQDAASRGDVKSVKALLDQGAYIDNAGFDGRYTPLWLAVYYGHTEVVKLLIERGADVNKKNPYGTEMPLTKAAWDGKTEIAKLLIEKGADIDYAIAELEGPKVKDIPSARAGVKLLERFKPKLEVASQQVISKEDLKTIVQAAVEGAKTQKEEKKTIIQSDIDKPSFNAAEKIMGDNDLAVVIGIEGYQNLPKSDYSYDDAKLVKDYVKALGFKERNIELITDEKATKTTLEKTLEVWLKNKAKPDSRVFIYYSGHGAPDPTTGEAYIVPFDGDPNYLGVTGYPLKRLYDNLGALPVAEVTIVLDACFSGSGGRSVIAKGARPLVMSTTAMPVTQNMAVISATQGAQISTSSPEKGHGIFTYYFLKAIKEGKKNIADIYDYIKPLVEDDAKAINVQQSPSINPDVEKLRGRFVLRK